MKLGRNEPCYCGSGKKYKKCCLRKDEEQEALALKRVYDSAVDEPWDDYDEDVFDEDVFDEDVFDEDDDTESFIQEDDYPEISKKEEAKVEAWWEKYNKLKTPEKIKQHLDAFLKNNPKDVIINLGLEHAVLFDLIAGYFEAGKIDEIIPYLMQFRDEYPEVYEKSAGYYDADIIAWLLLKNRDGEIPRYFNYFEQDPDSFIDKLNETLSLILAVNKTDIAVSLAEKTYENVWHSPEIIGGYGIVDPLLAKIYSKYLDKSENLLEMEKLVGELKALKIDFDDNFLTENYWSERIKMITRDYEIWGEKIPLKKKQIFEKAYAITTNYTKFLNEEKGLAYGSAHYYGRLITEYYYYVFESNKKPKKLFVFTKDQVDEAIDALAKDMFFINLTKAMSLFNGLYYFAEYLYMCGDYDEKQREGLQKMMGEFHEQLYKTSKKVYQETILFEKFPLFG